MRHTLEIVAFHAAFAVPGIALLYALGFIRGLRDAALAIGPAYLSGVALVTSVLIALLVLGAAVRLPQLAAVAAALTGVLAVTGFVAARFRRGDDGPAATPATGVEAWVSRVAWVALAAFFAIGASAYSKLGTVGDDWSIWSYKALVLFQFGGHLDHPTLTGGLPGPAHASYPILQPVLESLYLRAAGGQDLQQWHVVLWIVFASFVWTVAWLARSPRFSTLAVGIAVAALALTQKSHEIVEVGYADVTLACFAGAGAFAIGRWLSEGGTRYALLGAVLLTGGANTKNEGALAAVVVLASAAGVMGFARLHRWRVWLAAVAIVVVGAAPWIAWRNAKGLPTEDVAEPGDVLDVSFLWDRLDRIPKAFAELFENLGNQGHWNWVVPCLLVLAVVCIVRGPARREAAYYVAVATSIVLGTVAVYWTGNLEIDYWLENSADRTLTAAVFVCGAGLVHLTALIVPTIGRRSAGRSNE